MVGAGMILREPNLFLYPFSLKKKARLPFPFDQKNIFFSGYARVALFQGLKILDIKNGDNILVPDYICGAVLSALHYLGIKARYYTLNKDLNPNWENVAQGIDSGTKAMLIVNYFGFPNELDKARDFCQQYGIYLIEDNAHGYLSFNDSTPLGAYGDVSIFSFRKTLPLSNGAALLVNNSGLKTSILTDIKYRKKNFELLRFVAKSFIDVLRSALSIRDCRKLDKDLREIAEGREKKEEFNLDEYFFSFHTLNSLIVSYIDLAEVSRQRRKAYEGWLEFFLGNPEFNLRLPFPYLKDGVVPYIFPVLTEDRDNFIMEMYKRGIESFPWPTLPEGSNESYFSSRIVCLPLFPGQVIKSWSSKWKKK